MVAPSPCKERCSKKALCAFVTKNLREYLKFLGLTQLLVEARVFMSWRAAIDGEAIPQTVGETASAVYDRLAMT